LEDAKASETFTVPHGSLEDASKYCETLSQTVNSALERSHIRR